MCGGAEIRPITSRKIWTKQHEEPLKSEDRRKKSERKSLKPWKKPSALKKKKKTKGRIQRLMSYQSTLLLGQRLLATRKEVPQL